MSASRKGKRGETQGRKKVGEIREEREVLGEDEVVHAFGGEIVEGAVEVER